MSTKLTKEEFTKRYLKEGVPFQTLMRKRLLSLGIKEEKCENCGISEWMGKPIQIQIHHINGNRNDNRLENLQMLCPNCHAQTENYQAKNTHVYTSREKICINCGKEFKARAAYQKFCSRECMKEYNSKNQREYRSPYTKEFMEELCNKYNTLDEIGFVIHKTRDTVKRNLIQHGLFEEFLRKRDFRAKAVLQYNLKGEFVKEWASSADIQDTLNISATHVASVCRGERKSTGGFFWRFKEDDNYPVKIELPNKWENNKLKVLQYDRDGNFIQEYESISEASRVTRIPVSGIRSCLCGHNTYSKEFIWRYKNGDITPHVEPPKFHNEIAKPIIQYDLLGNVIKEYPSMYSAYKATNISCTAIKNCLTGVTASTKGYIFKYK